VHGQADVGGVGAHLDGERCNGHELACGRSDDVAIDDPLGGFRDEPPWCCSTGLMLDRLIPDVAPRASGSCSDTAS
jgi:hypothetical protein